MTGRIWHAALAASLAAAGGGILYLGLATVRSEGGQRTFFGQFVASGGPVVWFVLLPMSIITVYLAIEHFLTIRRAKLLPAGACELVLRTLQRFGPGQLPAHLSWCGDFVSVAVASAIRQSSGNWLRTRNLIFESVQEQALGLLRKIEWLSLIGNVAPMVGLFGTVFGMIKLFNAIVQAGGQPQPAQLADGISVALVTTFWGLSIAIPALALHGVFRNRIETLASDAVVRLEGLIPELNRCLETHCPQASMAVRT